MVEQMQCAVDSIQWVVQKWGTYIFAMVYIYIYLITYTIFLQGFRMVYKSEMVLATNHFP